MKGCIPGPIMRRDYVDLGGGYGMPLTVVYGYGKVILIHLPERMRKTPTPILSDEFAVFDEGGVWRPLTLTSCAWLGYATVVIMVSADASAVLTRGCTYLTRGLLALDARS